MIHLPTPNSSTDADQVFLPKPRDTPYPHRQLNELLAEVAESIAPVWPLQDYVAVNPHAGITHRSFLEARHFLRLFSDSETLMPLSYFQDQFANGAFHHADIESAIQELGLDSNLDASLIVAEMKASTSAPDTEESPVNRNRALHTVAESVGTFSAFPWQETITEEISKFCSAHYDQGQAVWGNPWKNLPLYQAWRRTAAIDLNMEAVGLKGFRSFVSQMPHDSGAAILWLLQRLEVPETLWNSFLICQAHSIPGWCGWAKYQTDWAEPKAVEQNDFADLLAIRLAYDVALREHLDISICWDTVCKNETASFDAAQDHETTVRYVLLRASEIAYRNQLLQSLRLEDANSEFGDAKPADRKSAQLAFCIDVRSERIRRHLEAQEESIETFGFAGFFGMPIEYVPMGQDEGCSHVPVLIKPEFQLREGLHETDSDRESEAVDRRVVKRTWRQLWSDFQRSAAGCFSFVETTGLLYGWKLLTRTANLSSTFQMEKHDGLRANDSIHLGPTLRGLNQQGVTTSRQVDLAESLLSNLGLTDGFARLVVFCGHACQTENNPLAAGLDCGACGGHSGEANARFAAMLLNQPYVRKALAERGIEIPEDTIFLAGLHNTTTDRLQLFDLDELPDSHLLDVQRLMDHAVVAGEQTRLERLGELTEETTSGIHRRAHDWSEVRPEWGLAGNASFVIGPRSMTQETELNGRSFLHSYDHHGDEDGKILEGIMTAPMVVAHWINMQYYASTVDNQRFGSGNKAIHNVVGRFGVLSGNGGDLRVGLPWQSLHTGDDYQHSPMRLQCVIAAPRERIAEIIERHEILTNMVGNGWMHIIAVDDGRAYQHLDGDWKPLERNADTPLSVAPIHSF